MKKFLFLTCDLLTKQPRGWWGALPLVPSWLPLDTPTNGREKKDPSALVQGIGQQGHLLPKKSL